jgi:4-hydroxy-tetrahydrodipicolinate reductase
MDKKLKIVIIGYGKMGRGIEKLAIERGHSIHAIIDNENDWVRFGTIIGDADVAIEFTTPQTAPGNIKRCFDKGIAIVSGTTAWHEHLPGIIELCRKKNQTLFYAPNFSIGVNIFFEINRKLATLMAGIAEYKVELSEIHHTQKLDAPSGTAVALANDILEYRKDLKGWVLSDNKKENMIPVEALRIDNTPGTHSVSYNSTIDSIEIKHTAHSRDGFIEGALSAATWVYNRKGIYTMKDLLNL